jgi:hypothetical protein
VDILQEAPEGQRGRTKVYTRRNEPGPGALLLGVIVLAGILVLGRASRASEEREVLVGNASDAILLLPMNVVTQMPSELAAMGPIVWDDLAEYLQDQGQPLKTARMSDARMLWRTSVRKLRDVPDPASVGIDDALRLLVQALGEHADFSKVLVPSLLLREAPIRNRKAEWDGVSRSVEFRAATPETRKLALLVRFEGLAPGASLSVVVLDAEGRTLHRKTRGLELIAAVRVVEDPKQPFVFESYRDLFQDRDVLREGIAQALDPFLPAPPTAP